MSLMHQIVEDIAQSLIKRDSRPDGNYDCSACGKFINKFEVTWKIDENNGTCSGPLCGYCADDIEGKGPKCPMTISTPQVSQPPMKPS